jgi:hypothetical protein
MSAEILGRLTCAICGNDNATIHRQGGKHSALYYRCYVSAGSNDMRCGTIQCLGPSGQAFLIKKLDPVIAPIATPQAAAPIKDAIATPKAAPDSVKNTFLTRFLAGDSEE